MALSSGARDFRLSSEIGCRLAAFSTRAPRQPSPAATAVRVARASRREACGERGASVGLQGRDCPRKELSDITNVAPSTRALTASKPLPPPGKPPSLPPPTVAVTPRSNVGVETQSKRCSNISADGSPFKADAEGIHEVKEYVADVVSVLFREESCYVPRADFMDGQTDINPKMRAILVDWLVEVHQKYNLRARTLFLTTNLIDRYLAAQPVTRKRLQLVGVAALLVAAKYEEIQPPRVAEYVYITDNAYTKNELIQMECVLLSTLGFHVVVPTAADFLEYFQRANRCDSVHEKVSWYLVELALLDPRLVSYPPSLLASAAMLLSNELLGRNPRWPTTLARHAMRTEAELQSCAADLRSVFAGAATSPYQAVQRKYALPSNHSVAKTLPAPTAI